MKLVLKQGSYRVTIPKEIVKLLGWEDGNEIGFQLNKQGELTMKKVGDKCKL